MLYRQFTIISLLVLGTAFTAASFMNESYRHSHYKHIYTSTTSY